MDEHVSFTTTLQLIQLKVCSLKVEAIVVGVGWVGGGGADFADRYGAPRIKILWPVLNRNYFFFIII